MKTNAIMRIVLFTLGILVLTSILLVELGVWNFGITKEFSEISYSAEAADTQAAYIAPGQINNIQIQWAAGNITIHPSDQVTDIHVSESDVEEADRMVCKISGNTMIIQYEKASQSFISFGTTTVAKDLVITVPSGWICRSLEIEAAAADVDILNMTIDNLDFDGASGRCNLENCTVTELDVDAASGDLNFSGQLDSLDFDGASANCTLVLTNCPSHIGLDGMSGDLDITLPSDCGFTVSTEGLNTSFSTDFVTTSRNGTHHYGDGACRIEIQALSGKVCIHDGGYTCHTANQDCPDETECDTHSSHNSDHKSGHH